MKKKYELDHGKPYYIGLGHMDLDDCVDWKSNDVKRIKAFLFKVALIVVYCATFLFGIALLELSFGNTVEYVSEKYADMLVTSISFFFGVVFTVLIWWMDNRETLDARIEECRDEQVIKDLGGKE